MNWTIIIELLYVVILILVCLRIIYDTRSNIKTLAYLLFAIFVPVVGISFYFSFGINYRKRKMYSKKIINDERLLKRIHYIINFSSQEVLKRKKNIDNEKELVRLLLNNDVSPLIGHNEVKLLINGENKFPLVLQALKNAKHHIHIEYYIYENDAIGNEIKNVLIEKARQGVEVRFLYDDFGSRSIQRKLVPEMRRNGVEAYPFYKIKFAPFANRLNYRNHRKIIIIDGEAAFVGGINISNRYINDGEEKLFWRDTHLYIHGPGIFYLQYLFMCDWNFCAPKSKMDADFKYFNTKFISSVNSAKDVAIQIAASGPDSDHPSILYSILQAINLAKEEILITSPYFIPGESLTDAIIVASLSGVKVKLLVPYTSDSIMVNTAAQSYYDELLKAGVEIYLYKKGFIHAKTFVADSNVSIVGTANMDYRSFELNFEVNAIIYDSNFSNELRNAFYEDLQFSEKLNITDWENRSLYKKIIQKIAGLLSPLL